MRKQRCPSDSRNSNHFLNVLVTTCLAIVAFILEINLLIFSTANGAELSFVSHRNLLGLQVGIF